MTGGDRDGTAPDPAARGASYSLTRRLTARVLLLVALGWLAAAAGAMWVLGHETGETLDHALLHEAQLLARLAGQGIALPPTVGDDRTLRIVGPDLLPTGPAAGNAVDGPRPWPAPPAPGAELWGGDGWSVARAALPDGRSLELGEADGGRREELIESIRGLVLVLLPMALALMWVIRQTLGRALRPVGALSRALSSREAGDLAPLDAAGLPQELAPVADSLDSYLRRIAGLLAAERDFAANAAHELRTPVATARAEAQNLAARLPGPAGDARPEVGRIIAALDRITALTERLLQLSRAESGVGLSRAPVDLTRLLPLVLADVAPVPGRGLRYDDGDLDSAVVQGDADGLAILIRNLVDNALRHGTGEVRVTLAPGPRLSVTNPVAPGARFRHDRLDRGPGSAGTGLGLTIAARLAEQSDARLTTAIAGGRATATLDWGG